MGLYFDTFKKLSSSILGNDFLILLAAIFTGVLFFIVKFSAKKIDEYSKEWKINRNTQFSSFSLKYTRILYTVFVTMISIFPLLGMFGTVSGLLGLDLASGDMANLKNNFFIALTSTAWGIIFSVIFKILNAFNSDFIEEQIEVAKQLSDENDL